MSPYESKIKKMRRANTDRSRSPEAKAQTLQRRAIRRAKVGQ